MADDVRDTQHFLESAEAVSGEEVRETSANLEVGYNLATNPGDIRETSANVEVGESVSGEEVHVTAFYLEAAYNPGPPAGDYMRDTSHWLEIAYNVIYPTVTVDCPFATSYVPGPRRQQTVCE